MKSKFWFWLLIAVVVFIVFAFLYLHYTTLFNAIVACVFGIYGVAVGIVATWYWLTKVKK